MQNERYLEGIPYAVQIIRWVGVCLGLLLIFVATVGALESENPPPSSIGYLSLLVGYGILLALPWKRLSRHAIWYFVFGILVLCSAALGLEIGVTCAELCRKADSGKTLATVGVGAALELFALSQIVCVWIIRGKKRPGNDSRRERSSHPDSTSAFSMAKPRRRFVRISPALGTHREQWIATSLLMLILIFYLFGLVTSVTIPAGRSTVSIVSAVKSLSTIDPQQVRTDHFVRIFVLFIPAAVLMWCAYVGGMRVRAVAWGCVLASLALPWFFLAAGLKGLLQCLYLPILAFTTTIGTIAGTIRGTEYQEGNLCMASLGWWMLLWVGIAARMVLRRRMAKAAGLVPVEEAANAKASNLPHPS